MKPEEHVRLNVPGEFAQFTIAMWVRVEALERPFHGLVMSDRWEHPGQLHWQILRDGRLELAVNAATPYVHFDEFRVESQRWYHLAMTCDTKSQQADLFVDGQLVDRKTTSSMAPFLLGATEIGNWVAQRGNLDHERHIGGQIGELMIFTRTLNEREIRVVSSRR